MKIWTIPNVLTFIRLLFTPIFIFVGLNDPITGAIILAVLASTDFVDGYIARRFHQESKLGRILDPISDRLLTLSAFVVFIITGSLPLWFAIIVGLREIIVSAGTLVIGFMKRTRLDVNISGKTSAFTAMVAVPLWVLYNELNTQYLIIYLAALITSIISIAAGYMSLYKYAKAYGAIG